MGGGGAVVRVVAGNPIWFTPGQYYACGNHAQSFSDNTVIQETKVIPDPPVHHTANYHAVCMVSLLDKFVT